jgi:Zn finger protein HypA/HybF involved in hydrogenase expression
MAETTTIEELEQHYGTEPLTELKCHLCLARFFYLDAEGDFTNETPKFCPRCGAQNLKVLTKA